MSVKVEDNDAGWRAIESTVTYFEGREVAVGVLADSGDHDESDASMVLIGSVNEFGTADGRIPERSYIRSTVDKNKAVYGEELKRLSQVAMVEAGIAGKGKEQATQRALGRFALKVESDVVKTLVELDSPPNAPATIARKGSSNPLIDTGQLKNSIKGVVRPEGAGE